MSCNFMEKSKLESKYLVNDKFIDQRTKRFIRSRKIGLLLPWLGILGMLILVFSLIMQGFLVFFTEIGFVANFYYFIDEYNWLADRISFDPHKQIVTHERDSLIHVIMWLFIVLAGVTTAILSWILVRYGFLKFLIGLSFVSLCYLSSRVMENLMVLFHIQLCNWSRFYIIVGVGTVVLPLLGLAVLYWNLIAYLIFLGILYLIYVFTYYTLIAVYNHVEGDLGGHKYFIDLPDKRFVRKDL